MRTPVIPGVNDTEEEIGSIANYVGTLGGAQYYELLLFNHLGESKYDSLQMDNTFAGTRPTGEEGAARLKWVAAQTPGLSVRVGCRRKGEVVWSTESKYSSRMLP